MDRKITDMAAFRAARAAVCPATGSRSRRMSITRTGICATFSISSSEAVFPRS